MAGNVWQWTDTPIEVGLYKINGSSSGNPATYSRSTAVFAGDPGLALDTTEFRVAMIPEPATIVLALLGASAALAYRPSPLSRSPQFPRTLADVFHSLG
jgi:hypothetical protein